MSYWLSTSPCVYEFDLITATLRAGLYWRTSVAWTVTEIFPGLVSSYKVTACFVPDNVILIKATQVPVPFCPMTIWEDAVETAKEGQKNKEMKTKGQRHGGPEGGQRPYKCCGSQDSGGSFSNVFLAIVAYFAWTSCHFLCTLWQKYLWGRLKSLRSCLCGMFLGKGHIVCSSEELHLSWQVNSQLD